MNFNNHGKSLPYNGFTAGSKLVLALGCNFMAFWFNQDSLIMQVAFGLTVLGLIALVFTKLRHLSTDKLLTFVQ